MSTLTFAGVLKTQKIFDQTASPAIGADANNSITASGATAVQVTGMTAGQTIKAQARLDAAAGWVDIATLDPTKPDGLVTFAVPYQQVRVTGLGSGHKVFAQF